MKIQAKITEGPLDVSAAQNRLTDNEDLAAQVGAALSFEGVVRSIEDGKKLQALNYEVYEPMTSEELQKLAKTIATKHGLLLITIEHSCGKVPVGKRSLKVQVASAHRQEAIAALNECIDRIKHQIPIWKVPVWLNENE